MLMRASVGRIVHFYNESLATGASPNPGSAGPGYNGVGAGPYAAIVTQVFSDAEGNVTYCNLKVLPPFAPPFDEGSVSEKASTITNGLATSRYWEWPPRS
jgi:hypothetical protein